jgi:short-subunit dehydrogenase
MPQQYIVWITGASSGIGAALAQEMASRGHNLILSARNEAALEDVKAACIKAGLTDQQVAIKVLDVTDEAAIDKIVPEAINCFGRIDLLVNNAGISQRSTCLETEMSTYRQLFEVDVFGQIALTKAILPYMLKQGTGHIAVTASVAGKIGVPLRTGYCAAKHAMMGFFDALRAEVDQYGIQVSTIVPGFINTNLAENALKGDGSKFAVTDDDIANGMPADKAAVVIADGLAKKTKEIAVGQGLEMLGLRLKRFFPGVIFNMMAKRARQS